MPIGKTTGADQDYSRSLQVAKQEHSQEQQVAEKEDVQAQQIEEQQVKPRKKKRRKGVVVAPMHRSHTISHLHPSRRGVLGGKLFVPTEFGKLDQSISKSEARKVSQPKGISRINPLYIGGEQTELLANQASLPKIQQMPSRRVSYVASSSKTSSYPKVQEDFSTRRFSTIHNSRVNASIRKSISDLKDRIEKGEECQVPSVSQEVKETPAKRKMTPYVHPVSFQRGSMVSAQEFVKGYYTVSEEKKSVRAPIENNTYQPFPLPLSPEEREQFKLFQAVNDLRREHLEEREKFESLKTSLYPASVTDNERSVLAREEFEKLQKDPELRKLADSLGSCRKKPLEKKDRPSILNFRTDPLPPIPDANEEDANEEDVLEDPNQITEI